MSFFASSALLLCCIAAVVVAEDLTIIQLSDFHYDPYFGKPQAVGACKNSSVPAWGLPGCDTSLQLMQSALLDAKAQSLKAVMTMYTGDYIRHDMEYDESGKDGVSMFDTVSRLLSYYQGEVPSKKHLTLPACMGNEDFEPGNFFNVSEKTHPFVLSVSHLLEEDGFLTASEVGLHGYCAYYYRELPGTALAIISPNTLLYSYYLNPQNNFSDPCGQFVWMRTTLSIARTHHRKVYIVAHIPPNLENWRLPYIAPFRQILNDFSDVVVAQFYGHTHRTSMGAMSPFSAPFFTGGPLSRISYTNPSYSILRVDPTSFAVKEITQRYLLAGTWRWVEGESFVATLGMRSLSSISIIQYAKAMLTNRTMFDQYYTMLNGGYVNPKVRCNDECWRNYVCEMIAFTKSEKDQCAAV